MTLASSVTEWRYSHPATGRWLITHLATVPLHYVSGLLKVHYADFLNKTTFIDCHDRINKVSSKEKKHNAFLFFFVSAGPFQYPSHLFNKISIYVFLNTDKPIENKPLTVSHCQETALPFCWVFFPLCVSHLSSQMHRKSRIWCKATNCTPHHPTSRRP